MLIASKLLNVKIALINARDIIIAHPKIVKKSKKLNFFAYNYNI